MCCVDYPVPTQLILHRNLVSENVRSVATKVAIQINCKIGGAPWTVDIPIQVSLYSRKITMSHLISHDYINHVFVADVLWWLWMLWSMIVLACLPVMGGNLYTRQEHPHGQALVKEQQMADVKIYVEYEA
jgi:hypothetical protein